MASHRHILSSAFPSETVTRDILLLCLSNVIGAFGEGLYFYVFPIYVRSLNADYVQLGIVLSTLMGFAAVVPLLGGYLADRYDRKKILILAWTPWIFAPLIYSFAENWVQLIPGTFCWGVSMIGLPAHTAYTVTSIKDKRVVASALSLVWASYSFSYILAPTIGGYMATIWGMRTVFYVATILSAFSTAVFFFIRSQHPRKDVAESDEQPREPALARALENRLFRKLLLWSGFFAISAFFIGIGRSYVPTYLSETILMTEFQIGLFGTINYAGLTFIGLAMGRLADKWRKSGAISIVLTLYIASIVPLLLIRETSVLMLFAFSLGGSGVSAALISSYVGTMAPKSKCALWISIPQTLSLIAGFVAPYLGGYLYTFAPEYAFIVSISAIPLLAVYALTKLKE